MARADDYRIRVEQACKNYLDVDELYVDDDGDIPIRAGSAVYYVTVLEGDVPLVRVYSYLLRDVAATPPLYERLNRLNQSIVSARVFWQEGNIVAATEVVADGLDEHELAHACWAVGTLADWADDDLQRDFGGRTSYGEDGTPA
jgi:Putative bacterial sensory transduction regulator